MEMGQWTTAEQVLRNVIARFPDSVTPDILFRNARCLVKQRIDDRKIFELLNSAIIEIEEKYPNLPLGRYIAIELAIKTGRGFDHLSSVTTDAAHRFPLDREIQARQVTLFLASGRFEEAETLVSALEDGRNDHIALIARWRLLMERKGEAAIVNLAREAVAGRRHFDNVSRATLALGVFERATPAGTLFSLERAYRA